MSTKEYKALISYYIRERMYEHAKEECDRLLVKKGSDSHLNFWRAVVIGLSGSMTEAIRDLERLRQKRDTEYPAIIAALYFRKRTALVDREEIDSLESALIMADSGASNDGKLMAAAFHTHTGRLDEAKRILGPLCEPDYKPKDAIQAQTHVVRAWVDMYPSESGTSDGSQSDFRSAFGYITAKTCDRDLECIMARARYYDLSDQKDQALDLLSQAIALHSWFMPALIEKAKIFVAICDWEQALDTIARVLATDPDHIQALTLQALAVSVRPVPWQEVVQALEEVVQSIQTREPRNATLYVGLAECFATVVGRNTHALEVVLQLAEAACQAISGSIVGDTVGAGGGGGLGGGGLSDLGDKGGDNIGQRAQCIRGRILVSLGRLTAAMGAYKTASKLDESNLAGLYGMIRCQIAQGELSDASEQLEFLTVIQETADPNPELCLLQAQLAWRLHSNATDHAILLGQALKLHDEIARTNVAGRTPVEQYRVLNPTFLLEVGEELLQHAEGLFGRGGGGGGGIDGDSSGGVGGGSGGGGGTGSIVAKIPAPVRRGLLLLNRLTNDVPGMLAAYLAMANAYLRLDRLNESRKAIDAVMAVDPGSAPAQLLSSQIFLQNGNLRAASQSLEQALAYDFNVRKSPRYCLVRAIVLDKQGDREGSIKQLEEALELPGVRQSDRDTGAPPLQDCASIFVEYSRVLTDTGRMRDAKEIVDEAMALFKGTSEEVRILIAKSNLAIAKGSFDRAVRILADVPPTSPAYVTATMVRANIYLKQRRDRAAYTRCYQELVDRDRSVQTLVALGEAYMKIQSPEPAISAFESALRLNPGESDLARRIGRALVATHDYRRAIDYYEEALRTSGGTANQIGKKSGASGRGSSGNTNGGTGRGSNNKDDIGLERDLGLEDEQNLGGGVSISSLSLRHDLAKLYTKLKRYEAAVRVLEYALDEEEGAPSSSSMASSTLLDTQESKKGGFGGGGLSRKGSFGGSSMAGTGSVAGDRSVAGGGGVGVGGLTGIGRKDVPSLISYVTTLTMLADVYMYTDEKEQRLDMLKRAKSVQKVLCDRLHGEEAGGGSLGRGAFASDGGGEQTYAYQRHVLSNICQSIAKIAEEGESYEEAASGYQESVRIDPTNEKPMLALANLYLHRLNDMDSCQRQCEALLRLNPGCEEAGMFLADLKFTKSEFDHSIYHCQALLASKPNHYPALKKLIVLLSRAGRLEEIPPLLEISERSNPRSSNHAGLMLCKGIHARLTNDIEQAVEFFNLARKDGEWGFEALHHLIEIYMNPDNANYWEFASSDEGGGVPTVTAEASRVIKQLIHHMENFPQSDDRRIRVLETYTTLLSGGKSNVDQAIQNFIEILEEDKDYIPSLLGMSTAFMFDKGANKARNTLKRIVKMPYDSEFADEFERSYLMLADLYIQKGKYDLAQDLCKRCLSYNKSCGKAWETMGLIMEKEQSYADAAECYERSWKLVQESDAGVGYKLAFNYLKAERYTDAIDICHKVISQFPDYPKIKDDILDKACSYIRP